MRPSGLVATTDGCWISGALARISTFQSAAALKTFWISSATLATGHGENGEDTDQARRNSAETHAGMMTDSAHRRRNVASHKTSALFAPNPLQPPGRIQSF